MKTLVCLVEERSAKAMLERILPKLLPERAAFQVLPFEGKKDLEDQLKRKICQWQKPDSVFLVMRDQDRAECRDVKARLQDLVRATGKQDKTLIRIACHELESFYLGDLEAVEKSRLGMPGLANRQRRKKYRNPDELANAADELRKLTGQRYQKIAGSRIIAEHLSLDGSNRSASFNALIRGIEKLMLLSDEP